MTAFGSVAPAQAGEYTPVVGVGGPGAVESNDQVTVCEVAVRVIPDTVSIGSLTIDDYVATGVSVCEGEVPITIDMVVAIHDGDDVIAIENCPGESECSVEFTPSGDHQVRVVARGRWTTQNNLGWTVHNPFDCLERGVVGQLDCFARAQIPG